MKSNINDIAILINSLSKEEFYDMVMKARGLSGPCQYCKSEVDNKALREWDINGQRWELELLIDRQGYDSALTVELNSGGAYEYAQFPINNCPFCGRKL